MHLFIRNIKIQFIQSGFFNIGNTFNLLVKEIRPKDRNESVGSKEIKGDMMDNIEPLNEMIFPSQHS